MNNDIAQAPRPMTDESGTVTAAKSRATPTAAAHNRSGRVTAADALPIRSPAMIGAGKAGDAR